MTINVKQLLAKKDIGTYSVSPDTLVYEALKLMDDVKVGALIVLEEEKLVGIVSERDYARKIILQDRKSHETKVKEIMTSNVLFVTPQHSIDECLYIMSTHHIRHLPVLENSKPVGVLSVMDVVKNIISEKEHIIEQLEHYISG